MSSDEAAPHFVLELRGDRWAFDGQAMVDDCRADTPEAEVAEHAAALLGMGDCDVELRRNGNPVVARVRGGKVVAVNKL